MGIDMQHEAVDAFAIFTIPQGFERKRVLTPLHQTLREGLRRGDSLSIHARTTYGVLDVSRLVVARRPEPELAHRPIHLGVMLQPIRGEGRTRRLGTEQTTTLMGQLGERLRESRLRPGLDGTRGLPTARLWHT